MFFRGPLFNLPLRYFRGGGLVNVFFPILIPLCISVSYQRRFCCPLISPSGTSGCRNWEGVAVGICQVEASDDAANNTQGGPSLTELSSPSDIVLGLKNLVLYVTITNSFLHIIPEKNLLLAST